MTDLNRRDALKVLGVAPLAGMLDWSAPGVERTTRLIAALHADEATGEAMRCLGESDDIPTRAARLWLLEGSLSHPAAKVRDGAAVGLCALGDPASLATLRVAAESESIPELREDIRQIIAELEERSSCRS